VELYHLFAPFTNHRVLHQILASTCCNNRLNANQSNIPTDRQINKHANSLSLLTRSQRVEDTK